MRVVIQFLDEHNLIQEEYLQKLSELIETAAEFEQIESAEVSISFVTDEEIRELNKTYRDLDEKTDVLSFPMYTTEDTHFVVDHEDELIMLGDIIISIDTARQQATDYGHSFLRELGFLIIHGFLHLLGYDHETEQEEQEMFSRQEEILTKNGLIR